RTAAAGSARARPHLQPAADATAAGRTVRRGHRDERRADAAAPGGGGLHALDGAAGAARAHATQAGRGTRGRRRVDGRARGSARRRGRRVVVGRFRFLTAGESHGQALGTIVEGVPAGLTLTAELIAADLARRQRGYGRGARQTIEQDRAEILSGV